MTDPFSDKPNGIFQILPRIGFGSAIFLLFVFLAGVRIGCGKGDCGQFSTACEESAKNRQPLVEFGGIIYPKRFLAVEGELFGHHAIAWKGGRSSQLALIEADVPDRQVADELAKKEVRAGNNLDSATWDARHDPDNPAADERVEGASLEVHVEWEGSRGPKDLRQILGMSDADYRFGDHRALIPIWKSGCIVCDVSCPGAKISNRSLTVRDEVEGHLRPELDLEKLPPDGTQVRVSIYLAGAVDRVGALP